MSHPKHDRNNARRRVATEDNMCSTSPSSERDGTVGAAVESDGGDVVGSTVGADDVGTEIVGTTEDGRTVGASVEVAVGAAVGGVEEEVGKDVGVAVGASEGDATGATVMTGTSRAVVDCG